MICQEKLLTALRMTHQAVIACSSCICDSASETSHLEAANWLLELEPAIRKQSWIDGQFEEDCLQFLREKLFVELLVMTSAAPVLASRLRQSGGRETDLV